MREVRTLGVAFAGALALSCTSGKQEGSERTPRSRSVAAARPISPAFDPIASITAGEYRFRRVAYGFEAANRAQDLRVRLDGSGALVSSRTAAPKGTIRLALERVGRDGTSGRTSRREPRLGACSSGRRLDEQGECLRRLEYERDGSIEWWENRPDGLEQGFTLGRRPDGSGALELDLLVSAARVEIESATAAILSNDVGLRVRYAGLVVTDADGRKLPARFVARTGGLRIAVDDALARYPLVVNPILSSAPWVTESNQETAYLGLSVASAGDVNNDGFSDVIIGAPLYDNGQADEGRAFAHYGSATGFVTTASWTMESNQAGARFGTSVASAGDVNGDGFDDVVIGAPNYDNGHTDEGRVSLHFGSAGGLVLTSTIVESNQVGALLGGSVSGAGDVNGDGFDDVIVGARGYDNGQTNEGRAFIHFGSTNGIALTASWMGEIDQASAEFGFSVAGAGDVNGDMFDDVIIGAKVYSNGETGEGAAFVYLGAMTGPALVADWTVESNSAGAGFGHAVASAGDVDNDGFSDVLVGAPAYNGGLVEEGRASLYMGSMTGLATTADWNVESDQATAELGFSVAGAGDVNADGFDDVVIGAQGLGPEAEGGALVYLGSASPFAMSPDRTIQGGQARGAFGYAVASAGDVNDDGSADVIVGAPLTDAGQSNEGRAFVFLGCVPTADTDGDTTLDCADGCERDPEKTAPGACGCGVSDDDSDSDGTPDCDDDCPDNPASTSDGCPGGGEGGEGGAGDGGAAGEETGGSAGSGGGGASGGAAGAAGSGGSGGNAGGGGANTGGSAGSQGGSAGRNTGGTGTTDKPEPVGEDSSCGCRVPGSGASRFGISAPALLALAFVLGRRRATRRRLFGAALEGSLGAAAGF